MEAEKQVEILQRHKPFNKLSSKFERFFFIQFRLDSKDFGELFTESKQEINEKERPAKSKAEYIRRFVNKEKEVVNDWLATELIAINNESTVITYSEAMNLDLKDFLYIIRSRKKYNQIIHEKMTEVTY